MIKTVLFLLFAVTAFCQNISWRRVYVSPKTGAFGNYFNGYHDIRTNTVTGNVEILSTSTGSGSFDIYSSRLHEFNPSNFVDTLLTDNGQTGSGPCVQGTLFLPGSRHPVGQLWFDSIRNRLWIMEGVCSSVIPADMYYYQFPAGGWTRVFPVHIPILRGAGAFNNASVVHDPLHDVFFLFGYDGSANRQAEQVYCDTSVNPSPGLLTDTQKARGCQFPDDWTDITAQITGADCGLGHLPCGYYYPSMAYSPVLDKVLMYGGSKGSLYPQTTMWTYDLLAKRWTLLSSGGPALDSANAEHIRIPYALNTISNKFYYHKTGHPVYAQPPSHPPEDWVFDPADSTWTQLSVGQGPALSDSMTFVAPNLLVCWSMFVSPNGKYNGTGLSEIWVGTIQ